MNILLFPWAKTMRNGKEHPKNYTKWPELVKLLEGEGHKLTQVGVSGEHQLVDNFVPDLSYTELCDTIKSHDTWIGVDSYGQHLAWSVGKPGITIFGQSDPLIFGHRENINLLKDRKYLRLQQFWLWEQCDADHEVWVEPEVVLEALNKNFSMAPEVSK